MQNGYGYIFITVAHVVPHDLGKWSRYSLHDLGKWSKDMFLMMYWRTYAGLYEAIRIYIQYSKKTTKGGLYYENEASSSITFCQSIFI